MESEKMEVGRENRQVPQMRAKWEMVLVAVSRFFFFRTKNSFSENKIICRNPLWRTVAWLNVGGYMRGEKKGRKRKQVNPSEVLPHKVAIPPGPYQPLGV